MINLHIKGDMAAAFKAANKRRIKLASITVRYRGGIAECFATTFPQCEMAVRDWYHEDAELTKGYGYPAGTLLFFNTDALALNPK